MKDEKQTIEEMAKDVVRSISWCDDVIPTVDCIGTAAALYGIGYRKQNGWISVDERLPDNYQEVLCLMKKGDFRVLCWGYSEWTWIDEIVYWNERDVTHWMPLPEAPKMKGGAE